MNALYSDKSCVGCKYLPEDTDFCQLGFENRFALCRSGNKSPESYTRRTCPRPKGSKVQKEKVPC